MACCMNSRRSTSCTNYFYDIIHVKYQKEVVRMKLEAIQTRERGVGNIAEG